MLAALLVVAAATLATLQALSPPEPLSSTPDWWWVLEADWSLLIVTGESSIYLCVYRCIKGLFVAEVCRGGDFKGLEVLPVVVVVVEVEAGGGESQVAGGGGKAVVAASLPLSPPFPPLSFLPSAAVWAWGAACLPRLPHSMPGMCAMRSVSGWSGRAGADPPSPVSPHHFPSSPHHYTSSPHSSLSLRS